MTTNDDAMVLVDFELDRRELFRASIEVAKLRLLIGLLIVLTLILTLAYFFVLIDEKEILVQTSPLLIGAPLVALGGQLLRMHMTTKQYVATLTASQRHLQYMFQSTSNGFDSVAGESFSHIGWKDVMQIVEKPKYFLLYQNRFKVGILPKRGFRPADIPVFRGIVRSKLEGHARVWTREA